MKIAIFGNTHRPVVLSHLKAIVDFFSSRGNTILIAKDLYDFATNNNIKLTQVETIINRTFDADIALSIGGDGTFLNTAALIGNKLIPILGINTGRLGFLADINENLISALESILEADYHVENRTLLYVECSDNTHIEHPFALNEVSVLKRDSSSMIEINTFLNKEAIHTYQADGLIISTPTGSTAYSLSVGGPIVVPQADIFLLSPVATHSMNVRPLVVPDTWSIDLKVESRTSSFLLSLDGRTTTLNTNTELKISKADFTVRVIKPKNQTFFDTLKNKLMWGIDKRN